MADTEELRRLVQVIDDKLKAMDAALGPRPDMWAAPYEERRAYDAAQNKALAEIRRGLTAEENATFSERPPHDYRLKLAGIRSTCTSGWHGLLGNWKAAARRRIEEAGF